MPSKREGFGSVALEAQACGVPVICSDIYGLKSSVIQNYGGIHCKSRLDYKNALNSLLLLERYKEFCNNAYLFSLNYSEQNLLKISINFIKLFYDRI